MYIYIHIKIFSYILISNRYVDTCICVYIYIYIYIYIYTNLPVNAIVRLPHPRSGDSQGQETSLATSADKQTRNHDIYIYI